MSKVTSARVVKNMQGTVHLFHNRKTLWQMLREVLKGKYRMSFLTTMVVVMGLLYIILPFDFDWIPLLGWVDDGFVFFFVVKRLIKETQRFNRAKAMERKLHHD